MTDTTDVIVMAKAVAQMPKFKHLASDLEILTENSFDVSTTVSSSSQNGSLSPSSFSSGSANSPDSSADASKKKSSALKFPPCVICGGKASGLHYGCNTCEACKNFFRRYLIRQNGYVCPKQNNCTILHTNKSNCSACRLAICLEHGMCKSKSRLGRYTYSRRTETITKVKQLEHYDKTSGSSKERSVSNSKTVEIPATDGKASYSNYDRETVEKLTAAMEDIQVYEKELENEEVRKAKCKEHYDKFMLKKNMFGSMNAVSKDEYHTLLKNYGIDIDGQYEACLRLSGVWDSIINRYCDFAKKMTGFSELSYNDQSNLLKSTHGSAFAILMHPFFCEEYNVFLEVNGEAFHMDECADRLVSRNYVLEAGKCFSYLQKLKLTKEEMALLVAISTFSGDSCKLENPQFVEKVQLDFVELLSQHLHAKLDKPAAASRFIKLMDSLVRIRYYAELYLQEMKVVKNDDVLSKAMGLFLAILPNDD